jgi:hypothetical protein
MKHIALFALSVFCLASFASSGKDSTQTNPYRNTLIQVPAAELPASAAKLVKEAKARDWGSTTVRVVKAAVELNPAAAPAIVGAIAKSVPEMAAIAAGTAAAEQPKLASAIAKAAAAAAPSKAGKIATAVCRAVPNEYRNVALAIAEAVPGSAKEVLQGVASAIPTLKADIEKTLAGMGNVPNVAAVLDQASKSSSSSTPTVRGPSVEPPYVPYTTTAGTVTPTTSSTVQPGERDYAKP